MTASPRRVLSTLSDDISPGMNAQSSPSPNPTHSPTQSAVTLKGSTVAVVVLHLKNADPRELFPALETAFAEAGAFLENAPVLLDVGALAPEAQQALDFVRIARYLKDDAAVLPVGVRGAVPELHRAVREAGLLVLPGRNGEHRDTELKAPARRQDEADEKARREASAEPASEQVRAGGPPPAAPSAAPPAVVVNRHVRAGQQVSAAEGDLVILGSVNVGAEIFAAGSIHVYGALNGRALAGIDGDSQARIFALAGNPELLAIAGEYLVNEELPPEMRGRTFAVHWTAEGLRFQILGSYEPA